MNILITGSSGMLGTALYEALSRDPSYKVAGLDAAQAAGVKQDAFIRCDITDYAALKKAVSGITPDIIIHTAAFTDVDGCEVQPDKAETVNAVATRYVAETASEYKAVIVYISTDFVFDGTKMSPYKEDDTANPINIYGRSKLNGEKFVEEAVGKGKFFIIRTSWLFGRNGKNFVDTILKKAQSEKTIRVVNDQFGSPTYASDLAEGIGRLLDLYKTAKEITGVYHITNSDDCSWYKFAQKSLELARIYNVELVPILSVELDRPAERPSVSILDNSRFIALTGRPLRSWQRALEDYISLRRRT